MPNTDPFNASVIESVTDASPEQIASLCGDVEDLADKLIELPDEVQLRLGFSFEFDDTEDSPRSLLTELEVGKRNESLSVTAFCNQQTPSFVSLDIPHHGAPVLRDYDPDLTRATITDEIVSVLLSSEDEGSQLGGRVFQALKRITNRVNSVREVGISLHDEYTGPEVQENDDGTMAVEGSQLDSFFNGLPRHELDGILTADSEISAIKEVSEHQLATHPHAIRTGSGSFRFTFSDNSTLHIRKIRSELNSTDVNLQQEIDAINNNGGLSKVSFDYETDEMDFGIDIPFGNGAPLITIIDKKLRAQAVQSALDTGNYTNESTVHSDDGVVGITMSFSDPLFTAEHQVRMAELQASGATVAKVEKAMRIVQLVSEKLAQEAA